MSQFKKIMVGGAILAALTAGSAFAQTAPAPVTTGDAVTEAAPVVHVPAHKVAKAKHHGRHHAPRHHAVRKHRRHHKK